jgi:uncharacterized protein
MPPRFLDTNILIRYFTRDDEEKAARALELLLRIESADEIVETAVPIIFETVYTLRSSYGMSKEWIRDRVVALLLMSGLRLPEKELCIAALEVFADRNVSFADAYLAEVMRGRGISEIYTWDRDFDRLTGISRVEP